MKHSRAFPGPFTLQKKASFQLLESAHALAYVTKVAPAMKSDDLIIVNLSGRG